MEHLKLYETFISNYKNPLPKVGQYVIMDATSSSNSTFKNFVENNIGEIVGLRKYFHLTPDIRVEYENIPESLILITDNRDGKSIFFNYIEDIKYISDDREELEAILASKKYNL